ncbi:5546_t:CDS:10 [Funneliformis geosporum]|uniref:1769_t:CDS:1 n=1 Tax=Funneliformis geosporum TaxID=1117311 RepID=A0A9W4SIF2_9GLOM|nr:1769_t:CDS:10 [Funneliformis geosporum]CAI2169254.1 5546_t:CDS:10 [Funneliformis geosporum]
MYFRSRLTINQRIGLTLSHPIQTNFNLSRPQFTLFQNYAASTNSSKKDKKDKKPGKSKKTSKNDEKVKISRKKKEPLLSKDKLGTIYNELSQDLWQSRTLSAKLSLESPTFTEDVDDVIESHKPKKNLLTTGEHQEMINKIDKAFIVPQLKSFLKKRSISFSKLNKNKLIEKVISEVWEIEKVVEEISKPIDLFFIIGPEEKTLREIKNKSNVKIQIDSENLTYKIIGFSQNIEKAKEMIKNMTVYHTATMELPSHIKDNEKSLQEIMPLVQDICTASETFIEIDANRQFVVSGRSHQDIKESLRLLNVALHKPDRNESDLILCNETQDFNEYSFFPIHDSEIMSLYNRNLNWHRVGRIDSKASTLGEHLYTLHESESFLKESMPLPFYLSDAQNKVTNMNKLGIFLNAFSKESKFKSKAEVYSMFGYKVFHDEKNEERNLFIPPLSGNFSRETLEKWTKENSHLRTFLPSYPYPNFLTSLSNPISKFQKSVQFDYVPFKSKSESSFNQRLSILLDVNDLNFKFKESTMQKKRFLVDLLMMDSTTDLRLSAIIKESVDRSFNIDNFLKECSYISPRNIRCPREYVFSFGTEEGKINVPYNLERMKFYTTSQYNYNGFTLSVSKISELETNFDRPEIKLIYEPTKIKQSPIEILTKSSEGSYLEKWENFISVSLAIVNSIGNK